MMWTNCVSLSLSLSLAEIMADPSGVVCQTEWGVAQTDGFSLVWFWEKERKWPWISHSSPPPIYDRRFAPDTFEKAEKNQSCQLEIGQKAQFLPDTLFIRSSKRRVCVKWPGMPCEHTPGAGNSRGCEGPWGLRRDGTLWRGAFHLCSSGFIFSASVWLIDLEARGGRSLYVWALYSLCWGESSHLLIKEKHVCVCVCLDPTHCFEKRIQLRWERKIEEECIWYR